MSFFLSMSLTVLHTGKRWFIICPVAETPMLEKEKTTSQTSAAQGMLHTQKYSLINAFLSLFHLLNKIL